MARLINNVITENFDYKTGKPFNTVLGTTMPDGSLLSDQKVDNFRVFKNVENIGGYSIKTGDLFFDIRDFGAKMSGEDITEALNAAQTAILRKDFGYGRGGVIYIPEGMGTISAPFRLASRVRLMGAGMGISSIMLASGANCNIIEVPQDSFLWGLSGLTLDGNKENNTIGHGLYVEDVSDSVSKDFAVFRNKGLDRNSTYKWALVDDICAFRTAQDGIHIRPVGFLMTLANIHVIEAGGNGITNYASDNTYYSIFVERSILNGIIEYGSNNRWTDIKSIWNCNNAVFQDYAAFYLRNAKNITVSNYEGQDNFSDALRIESTYDQTMRNGRGNMLVNCIFDSNGRSRDSTPVSTRRSVGVRLNNTWNNYFTNCVFTNRQGIRPDGYYYQDRAIFESATSRDNFFNNIQIEEHNRKSVLGSKQDYKSNSDVIGFRPAPVTYNSQTFDIDVPAISGGRLKVGATDKVILSKTVVLEKSLSIVIDLNISAFSGTSPRVLTTASENFFITFGGGNTLHFHYVTANGVGVNAVMPITSVPTGKDIRIFARIHWFDDGTNYRFIPYVSLCVPDANGLPVITKFTNTTHVMASTDTLPNLTNLGINYGFDPNNLLTEASYRNLLVTSKYLPEHYGDVNTDFNEAGRDSELFVNFKNTESKLGALVSLPTPSAYYEGKFIKMADHNGVKTYACIFNGSSYIWL